MAIVIYDPILEMTRLETGMTDSGSQAFSGEKTFYDQVVQVGSDSTPGDGWNIQNNGFMSDSVAGDTGFVHSTNGVPKWAEQTFRGEDGEFWYLYSVPAKANPITVSDGGKVGISAPPVKTKAGWFLLYHGISWSTTYRVGAVLLDLHHPTIIKARTAVPLFEPETEYEH